MIYDFTKFLFTKVYINNFKEIDKKIYMKHASTKLSMNVIMLKIFSV